MSRKVFGLTAALALVSTMPVLVAQTRRVPPGLDQARQAVLEGRYDEVQRLVTGLDAQDPFVVAVVARANIARGKYQEAETALRPVAQRAPTSEAALELGLLLKMLGRQDADPVLQSVARIVERTNDPSELARGARALRALEQFQEANSAYRDAATAAPKDPAINTAWGDLFFQKYKPDEAMKSYSPVLKDNPRYVPALVGAARALADDNPPEALKLAKQALDVNPNSVDAQLLIAGEAADAGRRDDARKSIALALAVNPNSLEAHALLAGVSYVEDKPAEFEAEIAKALAINPRYGEAYRLVAELASHNYRYDDATALAKKAIGLDPTNPQILRDLGIHLLRTGDERAARAAIEEALDRDDFRDVVKTNILSMLDTLDTFATIRDGDITIRLDKSEAPVIGDQAMALSHQALDTLSKRYAFKPTGPFLIEIFPKHDHFAVRIGGLPGMLGALGVCFGRVVALDSPAVARGGNKFQWEATLWHELAHVITLQMSNHRIPRWLTEGISTYEEKKQRPEWGRGQEMQFADMMNHNQVIKLKELNAAFTNPRLISIAYFEAGLLVEYIHDTYGDEGMQRFVRAFAEGKDIEGALKSALNTDFDQMQGGFDQMLEKQFGKLRVALVRPEEKIDFAKMSLDEVKAYAKLHDGSFGAQMMLGEALRKANQLDEAMAVFEKAAGLAPVATGEDSPHQQIAEIALEKKDKARAAKALEAVVAADFDNVDAARDLASLLREQTPPDPVRLRAAYQRIVAIDPFDADAQAGLGRLMMQANQPEAAIGPFKAVVGMKPVDQAAAFTDLAEAYLKSGKRTDARRQTLAALEVAPSYERAQNLLLELAGSRP